MTESTGLDTLPGETEGVETSAARREAEGTRPYRLTVRQFERMIDAGVIPEGDDVELLAGILVDKMTKSEPHNFAIARLGDDLRRLLPDDWAVREEKPVRLGQLWRPEPDLAVVRGPHERYGREVPSAADIAALVEVAETSYRRDRRPKWVRYAGAGVAAYWVVNLPGRVLEVYTSSTGPVGLLSRVVGLPRRRPGPRDDRRPRGRPGRGPIFRRVSPESFKASRAPMPTIRVPYPTDTEARKTAFRRLSSLAARYGTLDGTPEAGTFRGSTPIGGYSGSYASPEGSAEIEIVVDRKPILIGMGRIESELRKYLGKDASSVG